MHTHTQIQILWPNCLWIQNAYSTDAFIYAIEYGNAYANECDMVVTEPISVNGLFSPVLDSTGGRIWV